MSLSIQPQYKWRQKHSFSGVIHEQCWSCMLSSAIVMTDCNMRLLPLALRSGNPRFELPTMFIFKHFINPIWFIKYFPFESESDATCGQVWWPILGICALQLTHPKCTHTQQWTHTHTVNTHPEQWAAIYAAVPGEQLEVRCLAQGHLSRGIEGGESAGYSLPPPTIPAGQLGHDFPFLMAFCVQNCAKTLWDKVFTLQLSVQNSEQLHLFVRGSNSN